MVSEAADLNHQDARIAKNIYTRCRLHKLALRVRPEEISARDLLNVIRDHMQLIEMNRVLGACVMGSGSCAGHVQPTCTCIDRIVEGLVLVARQNARDATLDGKSN